MAPLAASAATYPVESEFTAAGPYATTSGSATDAAGNTYTTFYPSDYSALGFQSPIITWGNGTGSVPSDYTTLLSHLASYGFTVIASNLENTGSGNEIDDGAHYLVSQDTTAGSVFYGNLDVHHVAAIGHSQGATGATRAAENDPGLITALMTFSLPDPKYAGSNSDCPTAADCTANTSLVTQPTFLVSTHGFWDWLIAPPSTETTYYNNLSVHACMGIITNSDGKTADHPSIQDADDSGNPGGFLGYATAWLEYQLLGNTAAAAAFTGSSPELVSNSNWPGSACK
jgi:pimeloyl-ACP methyl ester carboxylesterase